MSSLVKWLDSFSPFPSASVSSSTTGLVGADAKDKLAGLAIGIAMIGGVGVGVEGNGGDEH